MNPLLSSNGGNVAILAAFLMLPLLVLLGGAYDVMRATTYATRLQSALDSAALASASLTNARDTEDVVSEYILINLGDDQTFKDSLAITVNVDNALNARTVNIAANGTVETFFIKLLGIELFPVSANTIATQGASNVELSLVVDISSSMRGAKLTNLKDAAASFITQILNEHTTDLTSINLVPFGGTVNIGADLFDDYALTPAAAEVDPPQNRYNGRVETGDFRFSLGDNCLEYVHTDFDSSIFSDNSKSQVPHFWRWNNFNPWCPEAQSAALMNTNDVDALQSRIAEMTLSDGTGMDIGAMWGYKALSPVWQGHFDGDFINRPADFSDETMKVLVIMTDGNITEQNRPRDWTRLNTHTNRNSNNPTSQSQSNQGNNANRQTVVPKGGNFAAPGASNAVGQLKKICEDARDDGIIVYAIGFQISPGSTADILLDFCASDASKYYLVESLDIQSAFDAIASSVNALRITG